jgi:hypothetical protein
MEQCMSFLDFMALDESELETLMAVVRAWCDQNNIALDSERGQAALSKAAVLASSGIRSQPHLEEELKKAMGAQRFNGEQSL